MAGALSNGVIRLDKNPNGVFYSGQVISGSVLFDLDQPITFSVLYIQFLGEAKVLWSENEYEKVNGVRRERVVNYSGREEYFNYSQQLAGGVGTSQLPAGGQSFPFQFQIPFTAPSSFKGEQGEVSYSMTVNLVYPDANKDEMIKPFEVVAPFDLNLGSPSIRQPIDMEFEEVYGCCSSQPLTVRVHLPASGYCPGQVIPISVEVQNESNVEITKMIIQFLSKEMYRSQQPPSEYIMPEKLLVKTKKGPVMSKSKRNFTCEVVVPNILPPYLENCGIMDIEYFIRITIKLSGCNEALQDESTICLGLVPIREILQGQYVHPLADKLPTGPIPVPPDNVQLNVPPTNFTGSNTSLHRVQYNSVQSAPYQNNAPPYPSQNPPYPNGNNFQTSVTVESRSEYQIGFKAPVASPYPGAQINTSPYPGAQMNTSPYPGAQVNTSPYPGAQGNPPPYTAGVQNPPYPANSMMMSSVNSGLPPYGQGAFAPTAPPP